MEFSWRISCPLIFFHLCLNQMDFNKFTQTRSIMFNHVLFIVIRQTWIWYYKSVLFSWQIYETGCGIKISPQANWLNIFPGKTVFLNQIFVHPIFNFLIFLGKKMYLNNLKFSQQSTQSSSFEWDQARVSCWM